MNRNALLVFLISSVLLLTSCTAPSTPTPVNNTATSVLVSTAKSTIPIPTDTLTLTPAPLEISSLPGFEDWSVFNAPAVDIASDHGDLILTLKHRALWFMNQKGVLAYKSVDGNFKVTADVFTWKHSNPNLPPGGDGSVQLGGLMARKGNSGNENYVFIVVGDDGNGLSVETKNTKDSFSEYQGPAWDASAAQLRICRVGQTFHLYKRHVDTSETWQLADSFERPDLPDELQVGVNIYTDGQPDLQIRYKNVTVQPAASRADCESD